MDPWKETGPVTPSTAQPPLTTLQRQQGYVIILVFVIWFPVYLVWVMPIFNRWVSQDLDSYPAELHVIPALALPLLVAFAYEKVMVWLGRDSK